MATKNPDAPSLRDATNNDGLHNHGFQTESAREGQQIVRPFGMDRSTEAGTAQDERDTMRGFKGGPTDLSASLGGATANQTGTRNRR